MTGIHKAQVGLAAASTELATLTNTEFNSISSVMRSSWWYVWHQFKISSPRLLSYIYICSMPCKDCFTPASGVHPHLFSAVSELLHPGCWVIAACYRCQNITHWSVCIMHVFLWLIHRGNESLSYYPKKAGSTAHTMIACRFNSRGPWPLEFGGAKISG